MKLTHRLKQWLSANWSVKANADDDTFRKAAGEALVSGDLTTEMLSSLTSTKSDEEATELTTTLKELGEAVGVLSTLLKTEKSTETEKSEDEDTEEVETETKSTKTVDKSAKGKKPPKAEEETEDDEEEEKENPFPPKKSVNKSAHVPSALEKMITRNSSYADGDEEDMSTEKGGIVVRVKKAVDRYDGTAKALIAPSHNQKGHSHPMAGRPLMSYSEPGKGKALEVASERSMALVGAWCQFQVQSTKMNSKRLGFEALPEHSKDLLIHSIQNEKWGGSTCTPETEKGNYADIDGRKLYPHEQKAIIDDATSGGLEAAPILFDDMVIQTPLLNGELFPHVNTIPIDRGRRIEGVATGTVTGSWGGVDDTAISLFDTTSYVTAFDTTIFRWEGSIRIGLDFLSDTPIDFAQHLTAQYGERLLEDLDDVIATGNGTTQPEGVTVKSGTTSIAWGGSTTIGNYESLRFGVSKAEHRANLMSSAVFCGSETSYQRAMAIPVGASDARRLSGTFGTLAGNVSNYDGYTWMQRPYKINESMGNTNVFYAILARYRMYRRRGLTMRTSTEGDTLIRRNELLLVAMARLGGQLERGAVAAKTSTAPA